MTGVVVTSTIPTSLTEEMSVTPTFSNTELVPASISGQLFLPDGTPLHHTTLYLTPGIGENMSPPILLVGPNIKNGDYLANTDSDANFMFSNVKPGTYFLVVSSTNNFYYMLDGSAPKSITVESYQQINLGKISVDTR